MTDKSFFSKASAFIIGKIYGIKRRFIPSVRLQYRLDRMVGPVGYWDLLQKYQISLLKQMGMQPHHTLLDIGCGPLQGGIAFITYLERSNYTGIDMREDALSEAYLQIVRHGLVHKNPRLFLSSNFGKEELDGQQFDYIWMSQTLYHCDEKQIDRAFQQIASLLKKDGKFYGDIIGYPNYVKDDSKWRCFKFHLHTHDFLERTAQKYMLKYRKYGQIKDFGYPDSISLKTNELIELRL